MRIIYILPFFELLAVRIRYRLGCIDHVDIYGELDLGDEPSRNH